MTADTEQDGFITVHPKPKRQPVQSWHVGAETIDCYINGEVVFTFHRRTYEQLAAMLTAEIARSIRRLP